MRVDLTSEDIQNFGNFVEEVLSKYVDNRHIQNKAFDPKTGKVTEIESTNEVSMDEQA